MVVVQYNFSDGTRGYEVLPPGDLLNSRNFDGPDADTYLLMSGDQIKVFVKEEDQPEECFMVRNHYGTVVTRPWTVQQASA
jgi:hypothetical protein